MITKKAINKHKSPRKSHNKEYRIIAFDRLFTRKIQIIVHTQNLSLFLPLLSENLCPGIQASA